MVPTMNYVSGSFPNNINSIVMLADENTDAST